MISTLNHLPDFRPCWILLGSSCQYNTFCPARKSGGINFIRSARSRRCLLVVGLQDEFSWPIWISSLTRSLLGWRGCKLLWDFREAGSRRSRGLRPIAKSKAFYHLRSLVSTRASMATKVRSVCDRRLHFAITATCPSDVTCEIAFPLCCLCQKHDILSCPFAKVFLPMTLVQDQESRVHVELDFQCAPSDVRTSFGLSLYSLVILTGFVSIDPEKKGLYIFVGSCLVSVESSSRTIYTERTLFTSTVWLV